MPFVLPIQWNNDQSIRRGFSFVTRARLAPKFGTLPIAYYQNDCCHALDWLYRDACRALKIHTSLDVEIRQRSGHWYARVRGTRSWQHFVLTPGDRREIA